jgi:hypothetical protein
MKISNIDKIQRVPAGRAFRVCAAAVLAALSLSACGSEAPATESEASVEAAVLAPGSAPNINVRRSLAITDLPLLVNFSLQRVLDQLVTTSGVTGLTARDLFQQWWDTQNPGPGLGLGAHCDDTVDANGAPILNGVPYTCRPAPAEGGQASCDPFAANSACAYIPIGLFMRFDLAPAGGAYCGEYRIVYGKASGRTQASDRNLLIFEAALKNPTPNEGLGGCERMVRAWANLSLEPAVVARRTQLELFYFSGYQNFGPIVHANNFGDNPDGLGQVRTNQFVQPISPKIWSLREFKLKKTCVAGTCKLRFVPVTNKVNPFGPFFDPATAPAAFQTDFVNQVDKLAASTVTGIGMNNSDAFNSGQSQANGSTEMAYPLFFGPGPSAFHSAIQTRLTTLGSSLAPTDVVLRAQAMSCAGCHRLSNSVAIGGGLIWPPSLGFTHVSERDVDLETVAGVTRYRISSALTDELLPRRKQIAEDYLNGVPLPPMAPTTPIGGHFTH